VSAGGAERIKGFVINTNAQLAPGEHITVRYRVDLPDTVQELKKLPNVAIAMARTSEGGDVGPVSDAESVDIITAGTILSLEKLAGRHITKTKVDDNDPYYLRQEIPYRIKVTNTTQNPALNIVIIDTMDHEEMYLDTGSMKVVYDIPGGGVRDITESTRFIWGVSDGRFDNVFQSDDQVKDFTLVIAPSISLKTAESIIVTYNVHDDYHFEDTDGKTPDYLPEADYVNNIAGAVASNAGPLDDESQALVDPHSGLILEKTATPKSKGNYVLGDTVPYIVKMTVDLDMANPAVDVNFKDHTVTDNISIDRDSVRVYYAPDVGTVTEPALEADITESLKSLDVTEKTIEWESDIILYKGQAIYVLYSASIGYHFIGDHIYDVAMGGGFNVSDVEDDFDILKENDPHDDDNASTPDGVDITPPGNPTSEITPVDSRAGLKVIKRLRTETDDRRIAALLRKDPDEGKKVKPAADRGRVYGHGDTVSYLIIVRTVSDCPAVDVIISDEMDIVGAAIVPDSIKIYSRAGGSFMDVTDRFTITENDAGFTAEKWDLLRKGEVLLVSYDLVVPEDMTADHIYNVAVAEGINTPPANDDENVPVEVVKIESDPPTPPAVEPETPEPTPSAVQPTPPAVKTTPAAATPETPEKEKPTPDKGGGNGTPKTGDNFPLKLAGIIATVAAATLYFLTRRYRKLK
jgi:uncharacterized repeat protein (TIGR01451 family)